MVMMLPVFWFLPLLLISHPLMLALCLILLLLRRAPTLSQTSQRRRKTGLVSAARKEDSIKLELEVECPIEAALAC